VGTSDLVKILGSFAVVAGGGLLLITAGVFYKFRRDIMRGERRRAAQKLRGTDSGQRSAPPTESHERELVSTGSSR